jgi:diadenosine tetraphosphate (Ap4A) HIT family hydrolase
MSCDSPSFQLHATLEADTLPLAQLPLSSLRLMDHEEFPWLLLVPMRPGLREWLDLTPDDRRQLFLELEWASQAVLAWQPGCKLNIAMLGNLVPQLHIHLVARFPHDPAWPAPVWGARPRQPHTPSALASVRDSWAHILKELPPP